MVEVTDQQAWRMVRDAFEGCAEECPECEFYGYDYCSETGADVWCELGNITGHDPRWCAAFDRMLEEMEDE